MPLQLYFPDGVPKSVQRLVDPDVIHQKVLGGLDDLERKWKVLAEEAEEIIHGETRWWEKVFGLGAPIPSEWMHHYLYAEEDWPSLPQRAVLYLRVIQRLRQMRPDHKPVFPKGDPPMDKMIRDALIYMAGDAEKIVLKMHKQYERMLDLLGVEIAPLCDEVFGEPCDAQEASEIANGDIMTMHQMGRFPTLSPAMARTLMAFLDFYRKA